MSEARASVTEGFEVLQVYYANIKRVSGDTAQVTISLRGAGAVVFSKQDVNYINCQICIMCTAQSTELKSLIQFSPISYFHFNVTIFHVCRKDNSHY